MPIHQCLRIDCLFKAVQHSPKDGEGYVWLGFQIFLNKFGHSLVVIQNGIKYLEIFTTLCPCDVSSHYHIEIA